MQYCKVVASGMTNANIEVIVKQISYISLKQINKLKSLLPNIIIGGQARVVTWPLPGAPKSRLSKTIEEKLGLNSCFFQSNTYCFPFMPQVSYIPQYIVNCLFVKRFISKSDFETAWWGLVCCLQFEYGYAGVSIRAVVAGLRGQQWSDPVKCRCGL